MKIDHAYLKGLLEAFEASDKPQTNINEIASQGFDYRADVFIFHMRLLNDMKLMSQVNGSPGFGLTVSADGYPSWSVVPLRLTANGHDFLEALRNKEVWNTVKTGFKDASIGTLVGVSRRLLDGYIQKKIDGILD